MANMKFGGTVVDDLRDIPANAKKLSRLNNRSDGKDTEEYKAVYRACCTGEIPHDKCWKYKTTHNDLRGPIYVDPDCEVAVLHRLKERSAAKDTCRRASQDEWLVSFLRTLTQSLDHIRSRIDDNYFKHSDRIDQLHAKVDRLF